MYNGLATAFMARKLYGPATCAKAQAYQTFTPLVKSDGPWDFKARIEREIGKTVQLGGDWHEWSTTGNITYGFLGAAAGFSRFELRAGAGIAQVNDVLKGKPDARLGPPRTYFDTTDDFWAVEFGYQLYEKTVGQGWALTEAVFTTSLAEYAHRSQMALRDEPMPSAPNANWPYGAGYFNGPNAPEPAELFPSFH
ncbi:MAG: hypothetical protein FJ011_22685 [Chloroflexi bacterium]|nr:hypothetical protein [Chloroflexota bacterium]